MPDFVVDHIEQLTIDVDQYLNEFRTLQSLAHGLYLLASAVWRIESPLRKQDERSSVRMFTMGRDKRVAPIHRYLLPCYFHWFATTSYNFARLVGFVRGLAFGEFSREALKTNSGKQQVKRSCTRFVDTIPELVPVVLWRHKVAAHLAITDPRPEDAFPTLDTSAFYPVSYGSGRFEVHAFTVTMSGPTGVEQSVLPRWSLTEVWESLRPRFFRDFAWPPRGSGAG